MHVLVTGAGGLIGRAVVKQARAAGWCVTGVARRPCQEADLISDLRQPIENWPTPDAVLHLAGGYAGANARELADSDLTITRNLLAWGRRQGIRRWVFASAAEVYGWVQGEADEQAATRPMIPYGEVKLEVERLFAQMANNVPDCRMVFLRIGEVYGRDSRLLHELTTRLKGGFCPWPGSGRVPLSFVHVEDVALALRLAAQVGPAGISIYNVADEEPTTWYTFVRHLAGKVGARPPVRLPLPLVYSYMLGHRLASSAAGRTPVLTGHALRLLTTPKVLANRKIKRELGFSPQFPEFRCGLEEALHGLSHHAQDGAAQRSTPCSLV
jgi:nucleoside-diphosphate-sugar epimerase